MAYTTATFTHPITQIEKKCPIGFSWTTLFFNFFPALLRGNWKDALLILILSITTYNFAGFIISFVYNKRYALSLIEQGYIITDGGKLSIEAIKARLGIVPS
ncbi:hypothetical protein [Halodesulfovibrio aestuarii]|uniref:DUF2628 domain-containing protein n=1 Tax=Halodesulfovibrio aestuarii TaxID=126333 RepID=A0A8G2FBV9_9BACT|nr:hypothetical protein [Halodesulfovibrio aestuarii]SHJ46500.1 hypothetical protein SAMN05660830_02493 [Halodesulfovibrio aestuarii]